MRRTKLYMSALLVVAALAASMPLVGCSNTSSPTDSSQGMIGGRGPDYNH